MASTKEQQAKSGITLRSVIASVFCMLVTGMYLQFVEVLLASPSAFAEQALPIPAMVVFILIALLSGVLFLFTRFRLLSRPELFCVLFTLLISVPMMTQGMWHRFVGIIAATPRTSRFKYIDAYNDKLWPHGDNLVENAFHQDNSEDLVVRGNAPEWREIEYELGRTAMLPVLHNERPAVKEKKNETTAEAETEARQQTQVSSIAVTIPVRKDGELHLVPGEPYLVSFLAKPKDLAPESFYFCRIYYGDLPDYTEAINTRQKGEITYVHKKGFVRVGNYGFQFVLPEEDTQTVRMEIGLSGPGKLAVYDPKLFSVAAIDYVYKGKRIIPEDEYEALPPSKRAGLIPRPKRLLSVKGFVFLLKGYIPVRDWLQPALAWSAFVVLLMAAMLAINVIMRKQWAESERYPFPLFQIPNALLGNVEEDHPHPLLRIWRNKYMWMGFATALFWGMMKGWNFYNPNVPNLNVDVSLRSYLADPGWGGMWNVRFVLYAILISVAIFFELNILLSLVLGFFFYRSLLWVGQWSGLRVYPGYPFRYQQAIGCYLAYAAVVIFFTRKYLLTVVKSAISGKQKQPGQEVMTYRAALILLFLCFAGIYLWAAWLETSRLAILAYFSFLVLIGFVASKFRAEAGLPVGYFTPYNAMLFVSLLGGMAAFGASGMMVCLLASGFLTVSVFFFIPGAQMELIEFGRRMNLKRRHVIYTMALAAFGGLFIGGWVFLSNSYAIGGNNIKYQWSYNQDWFFSAYRTEHEVTSIEYRRELEAAERAGKEGTMQGPRQPDTGAARDPEEEAETWRPETYAYIFGGAVTVILTVIRQFFAGFWFHPIGFILGSAHMMEWAWGSCLVALIIRSIVLKLGGAHTVKTKLLPFFVGVFVGAVCSMVVWHIYAFALYSQGVDRIYSALP